MNKTIILKENPKIEFQLLDNGFNLLDGQTERNNGFFAYADLQSINLNNTWLPFLAKWLRVFTWVCNGVPFFPDAESCKKANIIIQSKNSKLGIWLTDTKMTEKAKKIKALLDEKNHNENA